MTLIMSNPQSRNAVNGDLHEELPRAFAQVARDRSIRVVVLTGAGLMIQSLARLMNRQSLLVEEATGEKFALIGRVKFDHPLFAPFADPRFADFTKIHFWKHRRVKLEADDSTEVLASFDKGDPFLVQRSIGKGRLLIATSGIA